MQVEFDGGMRSRSFQMQRKSILCSFILISLILILPASASENIVVTPSGSIMVDGEELYFDSELSTSELETIKNRFDQLELDLNFKLNQPAAKNPGYREDLRKTIHAIQRQRDLFDAELKARAEVFTFLGPYTKQILLLIALALAFIVLMIFSRKGKEKEKRISDIHSSTSTLQPPLPADKLQANGGGVEMIPIDEGHKVPPAPITGSTVPIQDIQDHINHIFLTETQPYNKLLDFLFEQAINWHASDIHMQRSGNWFEIKFRIDGQLTNVAECESFREREIINVVKVMARLKTYEKQAAQDGRLEYEINGKFYEFRISIVPTLDSEKLVARIFGDENVGYELSRLGFSLDTTERLGDVLSQGIGLVLLVGPAGSGKTTSMYSALNHIAANNSGINITTVEDPIEHQIDSITQIQVNPDKNLTYESTFKTILRQDPEVIMIGEIRDSSVAKLVAQAGSTGHLIISTVHSYTPIGGVSRMVDLSGEPYLFFNSLAAVLSQRLIKQTCMHCLAPYAPNKRLLDAAKDVLGEATIDWQHGEGCDYCNGTGYKGRLPLDELLTISMPERERLAVMSDFSEQREAILPMINHTLFEDGVYKAAATLTTLEEVVSRLGDLAFSRSKV